jgi:uncharacterized protein (DUF1800 family)
MKESRVSSETIENLSKPPSDAPALAADAKPISVVSLLTAGLATCLAACGGGSDGATPPAPIGGTPLPTGAPPPSAPSPTAPPPSSPPAITPAPAPVGFLYPKALDANQAAVFLQQAQFSSTQSEIAEINGSTFADWLNKQYAQPLSERGFDWMDRRGYYNPSFTFNFYNQAYPVDYMMWKQLMAAPDAMRKRAALALSEIFVVSLLGANFSWQCFAYARWWDMLCEQAFGNFRDLLEEVTLNPAMGNYLNTKGNLKENSTGRVPDENYSREVMQLFTLGLYLLNPDGTLKRDGSGNPIDSYTQSDVTNLARVFTGYNFDNSDGAKFTVTRDDGTTFQVVSRDFASKRMSFNPANHSTLEAKFLGATVPANATGPESMKIALDTLFNHPNVGPFIGKQLIQRLVTSNPSPAYVKRVADAFNNNGKNVRGDLKAVWSAILLDDEARNPANASSKTFGKVREPMVRFVQWARSFGVKSAADGWKITETTSNTSRLGQSPLRSPSVFNFFRPGYVPPNTALATSKSLAPEFQILNEVQVAGYLNFMQNIVQSGFSMRAPELPQNVNDATVASVKDIAPTYAAELALVLDANALVNHLNTVLCAGRLTATNVTLIVNALNATALTATSTDQQKLDRVAAAVFLVMASSDYLVQR